MRLKRKPLIIAKIFKTISVSSYSKVSLWPELLIEKVESEPLGADDVLGLGDLVEEPGLFVNAIFADVDVLLDRADGSALAEGGDVHDPALGPNGVERKDLVDRGAEDLVRKELSARLMKGFMRSQVMMSKRKPKIKIK